jgi:uncharacterized membrane protein YoaK (UPF0700 family)
MVHVNLQDLYKKKYAFLWAVLSFKAGLINASGFLIAGSYVSHVTGFGTQLGLALGHHEFKFGIELFVIPLAFIGGGFLTSLILDREYSPNKIPNYPLVQSLITCLLAAIALLFSVGVFNETSPFVHNEKSILLIGLLCLVCGLKNGLTTWATHGKIRTTHLTGLSTDIGLHLLKIFQPEGSNSRYPEPKKVTYVRIVTLLSFSAGSCIAAVLIPIIGYKVFYLTFAISAVLMTISIVHRKKFESSKRQSKMIGVTYANLN